ncbi:hypothetical protein YC2023_010938 [Brassica napus]
MAWTCFQWPFFLQDDHERVENNQGQLLDAMDEYIFILKRLNNRLDRSSSSAWKWHGSELELVRKLEPKIGNKSENVYRDSE